MFVCLTLDICRAIELLEKLQRSGEVPPQKLQALQRVLQSEFCNAVREVYEHVYETVDISSSPEVRANATAKVIFVFVFCYLVKVREFIINESFKICNY